MLFGRKRAQKTIDDPMVRLDARWLNQKSQIGTIADKDQGDVLVADPDLTRHEIDTLITQSGMGRRIIYREPEDAIREGYELKGVEPDLQESILEAAEKLELLESVAEARGLSRAYGTAYIVLITADGKEPEEPLNHLKPRQLTGLKVLDCNSVTVAGYDIDPASPNVGGIEKHHVNFPNSGNSAVFHRSRVIRFDGFKLPERLRFERVDQDRGGSVMEVVLNALRRYEKSPVQLLNMLDNAGHRYIKTKGLAKAVTSAQANLVSDRLLAYHLSAGNQSVSAIDTEEEVGVLSVPLSGVGDVYDRVTEHLVSLTDMPKSILLGQTPGGLNTGENAGEIVSWYDHVSVSRTRFMTRPMDTLIRLMMLSVGGPTGGVIPEGYRGIKWLPLWQESESEIATTRKTHAEARALDLSNGVVTQEEARTDETLDVYDLGEEIPPSPLIDPFGGIGEGPMPMGEELVTDQEEPEEDEGSDDPPPSDLMSSRQIAESLGQGVSPTQVNRLGSRGMVRRWRLMPGSPWKYSLSEVQAYVFDPE